MYNDAAKIMASLYDMKNAMYLHYQILDGEVLEVFDIRSIANGALKNTYVEHKKILNDASDAIKLFIECGDDEEYLSEDFLSHQFYDCMFDFSFKSETVEYSFFSKGFHKRVGETRSWSIDDGKLFDEIFSKYPFDADDLDQRDFFLDTRTWPLANIDWCCAYSDDLDIPLQSDINSSQITNNEFFNKYFFRKTEVNPRINAMIDSIDKVVGQRVYVEGETNAACFVCIDYKTRILKFERIYFRPYATEFKSGSYDFDAFANVADKITRMAYLKSIV